MSGVSRFVAAAALAGGPAGAAEIGADCRYNGLELWGDVEIVESFPDIRVEIVESFPDLRVQLVGSFPDACGRWRLVSSFPKVRVQYVTSFPDLRVQFVTSFPGLP